VALLSIENVRKEYQVRGKKVLALDSVDLTIAEGEFVTVVGPSGCGKSTLLNLIVGLMRSSMGRIVFRGAPIDGITTKIANAKGQPLKSVLRHFRQAYDHTRFIVGHNIYFDTKVISAEFLRNEIQDTFTDRSKLDTIGLSVDYCAIKGYYSYKYPTLSELNQKLFNKSFEGAHSSVVDVRIVARCFWELIRQNIIYQDNYGFWRAKTT